MLAYSRIVAVEVELHRFGLCLGVELIVLANREEKRSEKQEISPW
jgi:hypothetical protein